jgi:hypothetical protein
VPFAEGPTGLAFVKQEAGQFTVAKAELQCKTGGVALGDELVRVSDRDVTTEMTDTDLLGIMQVTARPFEIIFNRVAAS